MDLDDLYWLVKRMMMLMFMMMMMMMMMMPKPISRSPFHAALKF